MAQPAPAARRGRQVEVALGLVPVLALVAIATGLAAQETNKRRAHIEDFRLEVGGTALKTSFALRDAVTERTLERIESGLPTGFTFDFRLARPRRLWWDNGIARSSLEVVAMYNAVTREYLVNYKQDGRLVDSRVVTSIQELEQALTRFDDWPALELPIGPERRLLVRMRAVLGSRTVLAFIPTTLDTDWVEAPVTVPAAGG